MNNFGCMKYNNDIIITISTIIAIVSGKSVSQFVDP